MPIHRYRCQCGQEFKKLGRANHSEPCGACGQKAYRVLGAPSARQMQTGDEERGTKHVAGASELIDERAAEHFRRHELPRIIAEQGIEFAKRQGFVDEDGKPK